MKLEHQEINLQRVGMKRRRKEVRRMKVMTGLMVLFLTLTLLFQDNMNQYQLQMNYRSYGEWLMREPASSSTVIDHPYLERCGEIWTGGSIYRAKEGETPDTMQIDPTDNSVYSGKTLGKLTTDMIKTGHIQLYEGKFPQKDDEIAMELSALQALGCDYDLGQHITFYTAENENITDLIINEKKLELTKVTFTLVGTIKSYTAEWNEGDALPNAIITESVFERMSMQKQGYRFLKLKDEYVDENVATFAIDVADSIKKKLVEEDKVKNWEEGGYSINQFAYYNAFWSNRTMYRNMTIILIVLGASVMSYLMSSYLSKRKKFYYRMREIGATVSQVFRMTVYECIYSVLLTAVVILALSYGMSVLVVFAVAKAAAIPFFYVFRFQTLVMVIVCVALVLALAMLCAHVILRGKRLTDNRNRLSRLAEKKIRKRAKGKRKRRLSIREMEKRYRMSHSVSVLFVRMIGIGVCVSVLACLMQINRNANSYHYTCMDLTDFKVKTREVTASAGYQDIPVKPYKDEEGNMVYKEYMGMSETVASMRECIPESFLQDVRELTGVRHLSYASYDKLHWFDWKGKGESEYYKDQLYVAMGMRRNGNQIVIDESTETGREFIEQVDRQFLYEGSYYEDCAAVWEDLTPHLKKTKANYADFCDGDEVILLEKALATDVEEDEDTEEITLQERYSYTGIDSTLREGDMLTIHTEGRDVTVKIGAILFCEELDYRYGGAAYCIVGSEALAKKIAAEDNFTFGWNRLWVDFNAFSNSEATDKIITRLCVQNHLEYDSEAEYIRAAFTKLVQSALVYGTLAVIITVLYLFIVSCVLQEEGRKKHDKMKAFHQLGVPLKQFRRLGLCNGLREVAYLLLSIPLLCAVWSVYLHSDYTDDTVGYSSIFFHKTIYEMTEQKYIFYALLDQINLVWVGMYLLVLSIFLVIMHVRKMHL